MVEQYIHSIYAKSYLKTTLHQHLLITLQEIMVVLYLAVNFLTLHLRGTRK